MTRQSASGCLEGSARMHAPGGLMMTPHVIGSVCDARYGAGVGTHMMEA